MGEVGVHLDQRLGALGDRVGETGKVGLTQAGLARPVQHLDGVIVVGESFGDLAGPVRGVVVDHEDSKPSRGRSLELFPGGGDDPLEILGLVVGGDDQPDFGGHDLSRVKVAALGRETSGFEGGRGATGEG